MSLSFLSTVRRFPLFLPAAKLAAAALVATVIVAPVWAQNCQTFYNPVLPMPVSDHYKCYQRFVWFNQGKGSWCARDWYRSCMHAGWHHANGSNTNEHNWTDEDGNLIRNGPNGWVTGYSEHDDGRVAPRNIYVSGGQIIVHPYVCRGSLKTSPEDPGQRIESNDDRAKMFFPNPTLSEIRTYKTSGSCGGCPAGGNLAGTGCN